MFKHIFLIICRNFKRFKSSFFINLVGLSTGLACVLLIFLWVNDELGVDAFHEKDARLYQVMENQELTDGIVTQEFTPDLLAETMAKELPEVEYATAVTPSEWFGKFTLAIDNENIKSVGQFAGKDYFNVFSFDLLYGDKDEVLSGNNSVVVSKKLALRLFGSTEKAMGKTLRWRMSSFDKQVVITGVFNNVPVNSTENFELVLPFEAFKEVSKVVGRPINWDNHGPATYVVLKEGTGNSQFNAKISGFIKRKLESSNVTLFAQRYSNRYLHGSYENGAIAGGRIAYVKLFSIIALFILIIACINFMNLSTAKASRRIKEVGIKKAIGAGRATLILQYIGESMFMASLSMLMAILIVELFLPQFNIITGKQLTLTFNINLWLGVMGVTLLTGLIAGSYPALYLSGFSPAKVLKGKFSSSIGELWARKGLVVFQFTISIILIISVLVVYKQIDFVQSKNLGYDKDNVIYFVMEGRVAKDQNTFLSQVKNIPGMVNASSIGPNVVDNTSSTSGVSWDGKNPDEIIRFYLLAANYEMTETLGIDMKAGRSFSRAFNNEDSKVIINEAAVKIMGLDNPVGTTITLWGEDKQIIGVANNFHFASLHEQIKPMLIRFQPEDTNLIMAKIKAGSEQAAIDGLQDFYQAFNPGFPLDYRFLDQTYEVQYAAEQRVSVLSRYFAGIAILISCLGLFGLAAFTAERRRKEIGVRKVLGASSFSIVSLLSGDFTKIVFVSIIIALPISWILTRDWLSDFAYRIALEPWYFISAGLIALFIAWLTVGIQAVKAASMNPVDSLRSE